MRYNKDTKEGTRLYSAKDLIWERSTTTTKGRDDFYDLVDIYKQRECLVNYTPPSSGENMDENGKFLGKYEIFYKDELSTEDWNKALTEYPNASVCIEFPKFYFKRLSELGWAVCSEQASGFKPSPMHYRDGKLYDKVYVYKYDANSSYISRSGQVILTNVPITTFRAGFKEKGFYNLDYACWASIAMLAFIKYNSIDSQMSVGYGWTLSSHTAKANTGRGDNIQGLDGGTNVSVTDQNQCITCLGLEDLWGNVLDFGDGICQYNAQVYYSNSLTQDYPLSSIDLKTYKPVGTRCGSSVNNSYGYIKTLCNDAEFSELMYPSVSTPVAWSAGGVAAGSQPIPDGYFYKGNQWYNLLLGGYWLYGSTSGLLTCVLDCPFTHSAVTTGSRAFTVI